jgi:hypothetical protein
MTSNRTGSDFFVCAIGVPKEVADDTISEALKTALKRLIHFGYGWYLQQVGTN